MKIGITERGDAALDLSWKSWVGSGKPAILITKNPAKLAKHLNKDMNIIVHCTITGHGGSILEPNVPKTKDAIEGMIEVFDKLHENNFRFEAAKCIVLRIDPIIPTLKGFLIAREVLRLAEYGLGDRWSFRTRISFMDNYSHIQKRFQKVGIKTLPYEFHADLTDRLAIYKEFKHSSSDIEICGEPGMPCIGCISSRDCAILKVIPTDGKSQQRNTCACLAQKHELLTNKKQCGHGCLYCYWK